MQSRPRVIRSAVLLFSALAVFPAGVRAQQSSAPARITQAVDDGNRIVLAGNTHPLARAEFDRGAAPANLPLDRMLLVLRRSPEQQAALEALLAEQQNPSSPKFHQWLTPQRFGQQFGPADQDVQTITAWLQSHGFRVNRVANGRIAIDFSGTAAQLQDAFHTEIHKYQVNGQEHWANSSNPEIPAALAPVVAGIATLHDFRKAPQLIQSGQTVTAAYHPGAHPQLTFSNGMHALGPQDFATIYGVNGAYSAGITGLGSSIAIVARSNIDIQDIENFMTVFGLTGPIPQVYVNGPDPGDLGGDDEVESVLDTTWASAIATNAGVQLVVSASTNTTDGVDLSELYIIDSDAAEIMSESYGTCEAGATSAEAAAISALAEQAAAEGITYFVSTGDSGAEGCDDPHTETVATGPLSVNVLASSPYDVAVGGTEFNENGNDSKYWNPSDTTSETALSYIPEVVWNDSCNSGSCPSGVNPNIAAGGGGSSTFFPKPSWQSGVTGIPSDGHRDLPDVSLTASGSHDPYLICLHGSCVPNSQGEIELYLIGGTSASTPSFAGIMALVDQKAGGAQGQANNVFYTLAAQESLAQCNGSSQTALPASNCIFNDVTVGNNAVPGETGYGGSGANYQSGVGYDLATGLGSVNVTNLVNGWSGGRSQASQITSFTLMPLTDIQHGITPVSFSVTVAPQTGMGTPTGDVAILPQPNSSNVRLVDPAPVPYATLSGGTASGTTLQLPGGIYYVYAHYSGDSTYLPSDSTPILVDVSPEPTTTVVTAFQGTISNPTPVSAEPYGTPFELGATVTGQSGVGTPAGEVVFLADGNPVGGGAGFLSSGGQAALLVNTNFPPAGQHSITAQYNGNGTFKSSTSNGIPFTIATAATQLSVQSSAPGGVAGQPLTLTATLTASSIGNPATGTVTFYSGSTPVGTAALSFFSNSPTSLLQTATLTTNQLPNGTDSITAQYPGDANYQGSTSAPIQLPISGTFLMTAFPTTIVVNAPGLSGSTTLTFQAATGFTGSATLSPSACSVLPPESTCSFSASTISFTPSSTSATVSLTLNTTAYSAGASPPPRLLPGLRTRTGEIALICAAGFSLLLLRARGKVRRASLAALAFGVVALAASCGGGGSGGGGGGGGGGSQGNPGTNPGYYPGMTVTVTINGSTQSINNLTVEVGE